MKLTPIDNLAEIDGSKFIYRGVTLFVARSNNTKFKKMFREVIKPYKTEFDEGRMDDGVADNLMIACFAKTILVGWEDLVDIDGKEWKYSVPNAESLLRDDRDVMDAITKFSENIDNYMRSNEEETIVKLPA